MEFWGVEVKPGQSVKCEPGEERLLHLSQAALGETKDKGAENVPVYVKFNDQKLVLGTLSSEKCAQISYDLVFEKEFELSHGSKNASVYFCGYKSVQEEEDDGEMFDFDSEEEEELEAAPNANGKPKALQGGKPVAAKPDTEEAKPAEKPKAKAGGPAKSEPKPDLEDDDSDEDEDDSSDDDEDMLEAAGDSGNEDSDGEDDSDDEDDEDDEEDDDSESEEEDEATPQKAVANGKKRPADSASKKTPVPEKKAKLITPAGQKTTGDGKKNAHVATPHPAKSEKSKQQTPKSSGSVTCKSCSKSFNSENALQSHTKAKHSAAK